MPTIPTMSLAAATPDIEEVYENGLYDPAGTADTLEILNGGLEAANWGGGENSIPVWAVQPSAFMRAWYTGFDRWEFSYARQLGNDSNVNQRLIHGALAMRVHLPFDVQHVWYGYQGWFKHDATRWDDDGTDGGTVREYWDLRTMTTNGVDSALYAKLPHGRTTPDPASTGFSTPTPHSEDRWKWVWKNKLVKSQSQGAFTVRVEPWAFIQEPDPGTSKVITPTGGLWIAAFKA